MPTVVIALRDESGEEISEWTTEVGESELAGGEDSAVHAPDPLATEQCPQLKVRFAKAAE